MDDKSFFLSPAYMQRKEQIFKQTNICPHELSKKYIKDFLYQLRHHSHHIFALLDHLPIEHFVIVRYYDWRLEKKGRSMDQIECFTIRDFYRECARFHRYDGFRIVFDYAIFYFETELNGVMLDKLYENFLHTHCERGLRSNTPVVLTREQIKQYRLTPDDATLVRGYLDRFNTETARKLQAEYDALKKLDCVNK